MKKTFMEHLLLRLKGWCRTREWWREVDYAPFEVMIAIAVSQRTYYKQIIKFMEMFKAKYKGPEDVIEGRVDELTAMCRTIGMATRRVRVIHELSRKVLDVGGMEEFLKLPLDEARGLLLSIEGIGEKTADMILVALFGGKYFIVDGNILRVLRRLNIISMDADIYEARRELEPYIEPDHRVFLHAALVSLGQRVCKVKHPLCDKCPLNRVCLHARRMEHGCSV
jgi:endonuclease III